MPPPLDVFQQLQPQPKWKSRSEGRSQLACNMMKLRAGALPSSPSVVTHDSTDKAKIDAIRAAIESTTVAMTAIIHGQGGTFWQRELDSSVLRCFIMAHMDMSPFDRDVLLSFLSGRSLHPIQFADVEGGEIHRILDQMNGTMTKNLHGALCPVSQRKHDGLTKKRKMECQDADCPWGRCSGCRYSFVDEFDRCSCRYVFFKRRRLARKQLGLDTDSEGSVFEFPQRCQFELP